MKGQFTMRTVGRRSGGLLIVGMIALGACAIGEPDGDDDPSAPDAASSPATIAPTEATGGLYVVMARPPNVPANYIVTPNGYFHPDCVQEVGDDEFVREDGRIARLDGTSSRAVPKCTDPRYDAQGAVIVDDDPASPESTETTPTINGWIESANTTAIGPVAYIHAQWNIPPAPASHVGQTIYFFPGLENATNVRSILQPVLAWNQGGSGFAGWSLASWNCCVTGTTFHSAFIAAPGSTVSGDISGTSCAANGVCAHWKIVSYDWASQRSTTLNTTAYGVKLNWVFGGALEVYGVHACNQLPGRTVTFSAFNIRSSPSHVHIATPAWHSYVGSFSPSCGYHITYPGGGRATFHY